jgi:hypothetical protein
MPRCANCNFNLDHRDQRAEVAPGRCDGCQSPVCFGCGCTPERACEMDCGGQLLMCGWQAPGMCNFCYWILAAQLYAEATSFEQAGRILAP